MLIIQHNDVIICSLYKKGENGMAINDNDIRVKRTKRLIRQGLSELAKTKSISKISVKELTDLVEINRGTFYLHYKDISDLVESIETNLYNEFSAFMNSITPKNISENAKETKYNYFTKSFINKDSSISESLNLYTQNDYIYETNYFTQELQTFTAIGFLSDGNKILKPRKIGLYPYFKSL